MGVLIPALSAKALNGSLTFTSIATYPEAAAQSTTRGKTLHKLEFFNGKLYAGYGDYDTNTGPIDVNPLNVTAHLFDGSQVTVPTEELNQWRVINGKLYTPMIDPTCALTCAAGYAAGTPWANSTPIQAAHVFDMGSLTGSDLWMVGADGDNSVTQGNAAAWRSTDGGTTWNVVKEETGDPTPGAYVQGFERYYWIATLGNKIYMQADNITPAPPVRIFDGTTWTTGTTQEIAPANSHVVVFNGNVITQEGGISAFDGSAITNLTIKPTYDMYVSGSYLYVLFSDSSVYRTADLANWQLLGSAPSTARSLAVNSGTIYLGTTDSKIYQSDQAVPAAPSVDISAIAAVGAFVNGSNTFQAAVVDPDNIVNQVAYQLTNVNNQNIGVLTSTSVSPYSVTVDTSGMPEGTYTLKVSARDKNGLTADQKQTVINLSHIVASNGTITTVVTPVVNATKAKTTIITASLTKNNPAAGSSASTTSNSSSSAPDNTTPLLTATTVTTHKKWSINNYEKVAGFFFVAGIFTATGALHNKTKL